MGFGNLAHLPLWECVKCPACGHFLFKVKREFSGVFLLAIQGLGLIFGAIAGVKFVQIFFTRELAEG
jgi:hypothetical protein